MELITRVVNIAFFPNQLNIEGAGEMITVSLVFVFR